MGDEIQIQRKEQKSIIVPLIQEWQTFNNQYLTQLTQ
jgi:virulence-associated protein VagC